MPVERVQVHQHRAAGVGHVGRVHAAVGAAGEVPQQPRVDRAERQLAAARPARARRARCPAATRAWARRSTSTAAARRARAGGRRPATPASSRTSVAVRVSCQTIALWTGSPVRRSHTTVVSRWLVMPDGRDRPRRSRTRASAPSITSRVRCHTSRASCSTQPACGWICSCSRCSSAAIRPSASNRIARVLVVPWSIAATYRLMPGRILHRPRAGLGSLTIGAARARSSVVNGSLRGAKEQRSFKPQAEGSIPSGRTRISPPARTAASASPAARLTGGRDRAPAQPPSPKTYNRSPARSSGQMSSRGLS